MLRHFRELEIFCFTLKPIIWNYAADIVRLHYLYNRQLPNTCTAFRDLVSVKLQLQDFWVHKEPWASYLRPPFIKIFLFPLKIWKILEGGLTLHNLSGSINSRSRDCDLEMRCEPVSCRLKRVSSEALGRSLKYTWDKFWQIKKIEVHQEVQKIFCPASTFLQFCKMVN